MSRAALRAWLGRASHAPIGRASLPLLSAVALALGAVALFALTKTYVIAGGLGDDGMLYIEWMKRYTGDVRDLGLGPYAGQRALSVLSVRALLVAVGADLTPRNIVRGFQVIDVAALTGALVAWARASRHLGLTRAGFLVATALWLVSFGFLRWLPFDPVLTDAQAVLLGALALAAYLERRVLALAATGLVGGFMWPSFTFVAVALLLFPRRDGEEVPPGESPRAVRALAAAVTAGVVALVLAYPTPFPGFPAAPRLFALATALLALVTFLGLLPLARPRDLASELRRRDRLAVVSRALAVTTLAAFFLALRLLTSRAHASPVPQENVAFSLFARLTAFLAVQRPLGFLVGHASFFGIGAVALVVRWRRVVAAARGLGLGLVAILTMALLLGLNSETRRLFALAPMVLPLAVFALHERARASTLVEVLVIALASSKVWMPIVQEPALDLETIHVHGGPWMSNTACAVQGAVALAFAARLVLLLRGDAAASPEETIALRYSSGATGDAGAAT